MPQKVEIPEPKPVLPNPTVDFTRPPLARPTEIPSRLANMSIKHLVGAKHNRTQRSGKPMQSPKVEEYV